MALKLYFVLSLIQLSSVLAIGRSLTGQLLGNKNTPEPVIPLKCLPQNNNSFDIFSKSSIQPSLPVKNLPQIHNLKFDAINFNKDGFVFETTNVEYLGLDKAVIDDFGLNIINNESKATFHTDLLVRCPYKANGTLFSKPIYGEGLIEVFIKNFELSLTMPFEIVESNDKKFIELKAFVYWYDTKDYARYKLDNLYNGDKEQSDTMHQLMNENWKYMMTHYGDIYIAKIAESVFHIFKKYLLDVPLQGIDKC